jgi:hypothetical protein
MRVARAVSYQWQIPNPRKSASFISINNDEFKEERGYF